MWEKSIYSLVYLMGCQEQCILSILSLKGNSGGTLFLLMMQTFLRWVSQHSSVSITVVGIYFDPLLLHEMHNFVLSHNNCNGATQLQSRQPDCQTNSLISGFPRTKLPSSYLALFTLSISLISAGKVYLWTEW